MPAGTESIISIDKIIVDDTYRISRPFQPEALIQSIKDFGMIETPVLILGEHGYIPFTCHNRISVLKRLGIVELRASVINSPDPDIFINNAVLKVRRAEVGPVGKAAAILIVRDYFSFEDAAFFCKNVLNASGELLQDGFAEKIVGLPVALRNYIDTKDIGFKTLKDIVSLQPYMLQKIETWINLMQVRVNVFRMIVEYLYDLAKIMENDFLPVFNTEDKVDDKKLLDALFRLRYPDFSALKEVTDKMISGLTFSGVNVDFPEYFEKDYLTLKIDIKRDDTAQDISDKFARIDADKLLNLLSLLK